MQRLEESVVKKLKPKLWIRYVDDTFVIIKRDDFQKALNLMNHTFDGIQFTVEVENERKLPFLDILIERTTDGVLETCVYRKGTHTDQILNFASNHPKQHKASCIKTLFARIYTHCSTPESRLAERQYLSKVFKSNGYSRNFIRSCLRNKRHASAQKLSPKQHPAQLKLAIIHNIRGISDIN